MVQLSWLRSCAPKCVCWAFCGVGPQVASALSSLCFVLFLQLLRFGSTISRAPLPSSPLPSPTVLSSTVAGAGRLERCNVHWMGISSPPIFQTGLRASSDSCSWFRTRFWSIGVCDDSFCFAPLAGLLVVHLVCCPLPPAWHGVVLLLIFFISLDSIAFCTSCFKRISL